jgi:hypothetical protein
MGVVPTEKVLFEKHPLYSQRPNDMSNKAWDALLPVRLPRL